MAATPYKPINWADNEPVFTSKLNAMTNNDQWLFENSPRMYYNAFRITKATGIKLACGVHIVEPSASPIYYGAVYFGNFFSAGCSPVIATSITHEGEIRVHTGLRGIGTLFPDNRGFQLDVRADNQADPATNKFRTRIYLNWIAMGW